MTEATEMKGTTESNKQKPGRKPIADKKVAITIYRKKSEVLQKGGMATLRTMINEFLDSK